MLTGGFLPFLRIRWYLIPCSSVIDHARFIHPLALFAVALRFLIGTGCVARKKLRDG